MCVVPLFVCLSLIVYACLDLLVFDYQFGGGRCLFCLFLMCCAVCVFPFFALLFFPLFLFPMCWCCLFVSFWFICVFACVCAF